MAIPDQNIELAQAADYSLQFKCKSTAAVDSYALEFTIRLSSDSDPILTKTDVVGITVSGSSGAWVIAATIDKSDISEVTTGVSYLHSLWRTDSGSEYPMATGNVVFKITSRV